MAKVIREIDVRKQEKLSARKCLQLVMSGISHRLLRSTLTTAVILLAVAFFMAILSENVIMQSVAEGVEQEILKNRSSVKKIAFMFVAPNEKGMVSRLAGAVDNEEVLSEYAAVSGKSLEHVEKLAQSCYMEQLYYDFFDRMDIGQRRALIARLEGRAIFQSISDEKAWENFIEKLKPMHSLKLPGNGSDAQLRLFVTNLSSYTASMKDFTGIWGRKIEEFKKSSDEITGSEDFSKWICQASPEKLAQWLKLARSTGFSIDENSLAGISQRLKHLRLRQEVISGLSTSDARSEWKKQFKVEKATLDDKLPLLGDKRVENKILNGKFSRAQLIEVARSFSEEKTLNELERDLSSKLEKSTGSVLSGRQLFLLAISFVVCMVGITNAMLMSITERFREIATMKCLGATDGFILSQFMMEAGLQGLAGGLVGMFIGFTLAFIKSAVLYGGYLFTFLPFMSLVVCGIISLLAGMMLASLASLYPSWSASRMAPMEAMRIE